jgi:hyperosmotically inducible protein
MVEELHCHFPKGSEHMNTKIAILTLAIGGLVGCATNRAPDVAANVRNGLKQAGLNDVTVSQDRDKGVVTLAGNVKQEAEKAQAEGIAKAQAAGQVVADQIAVLPAGAESATKTVNSDLDKGIENNLDAALTAANINGVHHSTKNGVVTLKGTLPSQAMRASVERAATAVPNVQQVVNEIDVKNQRATSSSSADRSK